MTTRSATVLVAEWMFLSQLSSMLCCRKWRLMVLLILFHGTSSVFWSLFLRDKLLTHCFLINSYRQPHGRCFVIHKPREFVDQVMPEYFRQSKLTSFQRQLNLYGFRRLTTGADRGGYYHEMFLKHKLFLCQGMVSALSRVHFHLPWFIYLFLFTNQYCF